MRVEDEDVAQCGRSTVTMEHVFDVVASPDIAITYDRIAFSLDSHFRRRRHPCGPGSVRGGAGCSWRRRDEETADGGLNRARRRSIGGSCCAGTEERYILDTQSSFDIAQTSQTQTSSNDGGRKDSPTDAQARSLWGSVL